MSSPVVPLSQTNLQDAFDAFVRAAGRLEHTHRELHDEVNFLRSELEERNRALVSSLAQNENMRADLNQILETLPCGILVLENSAKIVTLANPEAIEILGLHSSAPPWAELPDPIQVLMEHVAQHGLDGDEREICVQNHAGNERCLSIRHRFVTVPVTDDLVVTERSVLIIRDITEQKRMSQEREASRNQVALSEMASILAHEIRNPLAALELLGTALVEDASLTSDAWQCVRHLQAGIRSLSATVNNTLTFHNPGNANFCRIQVGRALKAASEFVRPLAEQSEINLKVEETFGDSEIEATTSGLQQIILNLTCNSLRHTARGGSIGIRGHIGSDRNGRTAVVEFSDNGAGIPCTDLPRVFDPGFTGEKKGLGLGLAVCRQIMEQHRGNITVKSTRERGTTFRLEFPLA